MPIATGRTVAAKGIPGDVYVYGQGENISMADWAALILRVGEEQGYWPKREIVTIADRLLKRDGRMVRAIETIGPGDHAMEGEPFRLDLG